MITNKYASSVGWGVQGTSCSLAVSMQAYAGVTPHVLDFAEQYETASVTAAKHADKYATNIHPVRNLVFIFYRV